MKPSSLNLNRKCISCHKTKPIVEFRKRRVDYGGGYYTNCVKCLKKSKNMNVPKTPDINLSGPVDLAFLRDPYAMTNEEIKRFLLVVRYYVSHPFRMPMNVIFRKHFNHLPRMRCRQLIEEFTEAEAHGDKFENYIKSDRKYRKDGKKVIANPKKGS